MKHTLYLFTILLVLVFAFPASAQRKQVKPPADERTQQLEREREALKKLKQQQELELEVIQLREETARNAKVLEKKRAGEAEDTVISEDIGSVSKENIAVKAIVTNGPVAEAENGGTRGGKTAAGEGTERGGKTGGGVGAGGGKSGSDFSVANTSGGAASLLKDTLVNTAAVKEDAPVKEKAPAAAAAQDDDAAAEVAKATATAQNSECFVASAGDPLRESLCDLAKVVIKRKLAARGEGISLANDSDILQSLFSLRLANTGVFEKEIVTFLLAGENERTDKQEGSDARAGGSTSLVVKGAVPKFLSLAQENGAVESSREGNTITFRANLVGFPESLATGWYSSYFKDLPAIPAPTDITAALFKKDDPMVSALRKVSVGFSYDINRGGETPVFTGTRNQLSAISVRYNFFNGRDPANPIYKDKWDAFLEKSATAFTDVAEAVFKALVEEVPNSPTFQRRFINSDLKAWFDKTSQLVSAVKIDKTMDTITAENKIYAVLASQVNVLPVDKIKSDATVVKALRDINLASISYVAQKNKLLDEIEHGNVFTVEYTNYREVNAPDLSNLRFIYSKGFGPGTDLTFNGSVSIYNKLPQAALLAKVRRVRDFDFALQFDMPLDFFKSDTDRARDRAALINPFRQNFLGTPQLSLAAKYQRLNSDAVLPDGNIKTGTRGDLFFTQGKIEIPINFNGLSMKIPFSFTYSNRTDLIKEKDIRGNFGITFDINPFLKRLRDNLLEGFLNRQ